MDLDIEMDVDVGVDYAQNDPQIPEAYTQDIITGEEQVGHVATGPDFVVGHSADWHPPL